MLGTGLLVLSTRVLRRWLGWIAVAASPFLLVQTFGLGGIIADFGLVFDLIGFLLFLIFILGSSYVRMRADGSGTAATSPNAQEAF
jgi:hypothetical protein